MRARPRPRHHPLLAVLAEAHFLLHGWLRSGNCASARGVVEFLKEALALWSQRQKIRLVRADSGFFDDQLLSFLEERRLPYIVVARMTRFIQREAQRVAHWRALDKNFSAGQFRLQLCGWGLARRFVVVRERRSPKGRKLMDVPGYTFRVFVATRSDAEEETWRDYNRRAGRRVVLHLSESCGGLKTRSSLIDSIFKWEFPASPKLELALET